MKITFLGGTETIIGFGFLLEGLRILLQQHTQFPVGVAGYRDVLQLP